VHLKHCALLLFAFLFCSFFTGESRAAKGSPASKSEVLKKEDGRDFALKKERRSKALAHYAMGVIYDNRGKADLALREYKKSLKANPQSAPARLRLAVDYLILGEDEKASGELEIIKKSDPENSHARFLLALLHSSRGEFEKAREEYEAIISYSPEDVRALSSLADIFVIQEKMTEAKDVYEKLLEQESGEPVLHFNLGIIYSRLNRPEDSLRETEKAIDLYPDYLEA